MDIKQIDWFDDHFYKIRYENKAKVEVEDYIPSVTTKIGALAKPNLVRWYGDLGTREANERVKESADRGSRIHWAWHIYCSGGAVIYNPLKTPLYSKDEIEEIRQRYSMIFVLTEQEEMWDLMKLEKFYKMLSPEETLSEIIVCDIKNRDAGTADNIFGGIKGGEYEFNGKATTLEAGDYICDLKTGKYIGREAEMQCACYFKCAEIMGISKNLKGAMIAHTGSKTRTGIEGFGVKVMNKDDIEEAYQDYRDIAKVWERHFGTRKPVIRQIPGIITQGEL